LKKLPVIILLSFLIVPSLAGQEKEVFVQVDGFVRDKYLNPVPNVNIYSLKVRKGSSSNQDGIYSIISTPGDTIVFSTVGFRRTLLAIPDKVTGLNFQADVYLEYDTIAINDVLVLQWGSYAEFKRAVLEADVHNAQVENMNDNLILIQKQLITNTGLSPDAAYKQVSRQFADAAYLRGQSPANNLLNPFAWAKFFNGLKSGLLKNDRK
jgi:hypothetical protein